jgi:GTP-binding protein
MLVTTLEYSNYVGKIAVGRLTSGSLRSGQAIAQITPTGEIIQSKVTQIYTFQNLERVPQTLVEAGTIVAVAGIANVGIGDTLADPLDPRPLPPITVEAPTVRMTFSVNDSPFAGREGNYLTSRQIHARLMQELESNVAMTVEETDRATEFIVSGRGELHLAIFIETIRREGYEFAVSRPEVIYRDSLEGLLEPVEKVYIDVHTDYLGAVSELLGRRRGQMVNIHYGTEDNVSVEYLVPTRGMLGFRQPFLTTTRGTGIFNSLFHGYELFMGEVDVQDSGSMVSLETGVVVGYALQHLVQRGAFFVSPGDEVYAGQVVGQHIRYEELVVNVCKAKNLTNHRGAPTSIVEGLAPPRNMSLDDAIDYLGKDELLEITPKSLRIRKKFLKHDVRQKGAKKARMAMA